MGNGSQAAARIDHGPIAMMTASASITAPSTSTPVTRPAVCRMPVTVPRRNSAPCASAARIVAAVNKAGWTCAVSRSLAAVLGEFCVQIEAVARELLQWRAVAPMAREKAAGFAGSGAGDAGALDDDRLYAAAAQEIRDRG